MLINTNFIRESASFSLEVKENCLSKRCTFKRNILKRGDNQTYLIE